MAKRVYAWRAPDYKVKKDLKGPSTMPGGKARTVTPYRDVKKRVATGKRRAADVESTLKGRLPKYRAAGERLVKRDLATADTDAERKLRHGAARAGIYKGTAHRDALSDAMRESVRRRTGARSKILQDEIGRKSRIAQQGQTLRGLAATGRIGGGSRAVPGSFKPMDATLSSEFGKTPAGTGGYTPYTGKTGVKKSRVSIIPW